MAAGSLAACSTEKAAAPVSAATTPGHTKFASLKQINAGPLNIGYAEDGPANGQPVILLHGWPYDIFSYVDVAPLLAAAGLPGHRAVPARLRHHARSSRPTPSATGSRPPSPRTSSR